MGKALAIAGGVVVLAIIGAATDHHSAGGTDHGGKSGAVSACEPAIRDQLTAPDTAHFDEVTVQSFGGGLFNVDGAVSADNSFGAFVQNGYHCSLKYSGGQWSVSKANVIIG